MATLTETEQRFLGDLKDALKSSYAGDLDGLNFIKDHAGDASNIVEGLLKRLS